MGAKSVEGLPLADQGDGARLVVSTLTGDDLQAIGFSLGNVSRTYKCGGHLKSDYFTVIEPIDSILKMDEFAGKILSFIK